MRVNFKLKFKLNQFHMDNVLKEVISMFGDEEYVKNAGNTVYFEFIISVEK